MIVRLLLQIHPGECEFTFNVREVRAFLFFCDGLGGFDCKLSFGVMGQPMLFETVQRHGFQRDGGMGDERDAMQPLIKMELVVATLAEPQSQQSPASTPQPAHTPVQRVQQQQQQQQQAPLQSSQGHAASQSQRDQTMSQAFLQKQSAVVHAGQGDYGEGEYVPPTP